MCDTMVVVDDEQVLFAKNSDREPNEAQVLDWRPAAEYPEGTTVRCTGLTIPQVRRTHAVLLSRPFWMWGAEMGTNAHGVTIGNEAIFARHRVPKAGLTGMDLLRLALERAETAEEAAAIIGELIDAHGQGGRCGLAHQGFRYFSSFLIADPRSAFVLETAAGDRRVQPIRGAYAISNALTPGTFARRHADPLRGLVAAARGRRSTTLSAATRATSVSDLMKVLRSHGGQTWPRYGPVRGSLTSVCMHGGGLFGSQTTASWVASLSPGRTQHWATATSSPCLALFKPVDVQTPVDLGAAPTEVEDESSLWWTHERVARRVMAAPEALAPQILPERDRLEAQWLASPPPSPAAFAEAGRALQGWSSAVEAAEAQDARPRSARRFWNRQSALARSPT